MRAELHDMPAKAAAIGGKDASPLHQYICVRINQSRLTHVCTASVSLALTKYSLPGVSPSAGVGRHVAATAATKHLRFYQGCVSL